MDINYKGSLQTLCQRRGFALPQYHVIQQSGPDHQVEFEVEVEVNGERFGGGRSYSRIKEAHQSVAKIALEKLLNNLLPSFSHFPAPPPTYGSLYKPRSMKHMPPAHKDIEEAILDIISAQGGRIRKIWAPDEHGEYKFEITGTYRFCENIRRHHRKNHIYFVVHPEKNIYYQKCHDNQCIGYQSVKRTLVGPPSKNRI